MPKPTPEQLEKINRFSMKKLTEDDVYVFYDLMIDNLPVEVYGILIHDNLLSKFLQDTTKGIPLLLNHNVLSLPVGRSFDAEIREEYDPQLKRTVKTLYGWFYIDLGRNTDSGLTTDDIVKGIESGTIFDTSIGFYSKSWTCSICGHDIRDWENCSHFPGMEYTITEDGQEKKVTCYVIAGQDGQGELTENSLVYSGACDRASIQKTFSVKLNSENNIGTKLHVVEDIKRVPLDATIYQFYSKHGCFLFADAPERSGDVTFEKRSESAVELSQVKEVLNKFNIKSDSVDELTASLTELVNKDAEKEAQVRELSKKLEEASAKLKEAEEQLAKKDETISELTRVNEELAQKAELANTYRKDLIDKALELGVRAQGNAFKADLFAKFLETLSVDEIKEVINGFEEEIKARFANARVSKPQDKSERLSAEPQSREDFETEEEFRAFIAEEAQRYAKEHNVSITDATKLVYKKYTKGSDK